ncbi:hypothetical protein HanIR_Chr06g0284231 [Helianthus annuus]|nr:hypothetical protein HanIR_Chr06g0284231 [Helianthus annuus]
MALTLRKRHNLNMLNNPYDCKDPEGILLASSEGIVEMTSNANQVIIYLLAICFGSSTRR